MNFSQEVGFFFFRILLPLLLVSLQWMLFRRLHNWLKRFEQPGLSPVTGSLFVLFNLALLYAAFFRPKVSDFPEWFLYAGVYPFYIWHGSTFFLGIALLIGSVLKLPFRLGAWAAKRVPATRSTALAFASHPRVQAFDASRRKFLRRTVYGLTAASVGGNVYGLVIERNACEYTNAEFPIQNLPHEFDGLRIGVISDIHSGSFMTKNQMEEYVRQLNALQSDLIVVLGDFVNSMVREVYPFAEAFSNLSAPLGVYGVMGNHDFYNQDPDRVAREVDDCGIRLLRDDKTVIEKDGAKLYLVGVDDIGRATNAPIKLEAALGNAPLAIPRILLCHRPYYLNQAASYSFDLVLSGHTHGGQIVLGQMGNTILAPASLASRYVWGKYRVHNTHMYVSRGVGTVGLPLRINCPPEITTVVLRKSA